MLGLRCLAGLIMCAFIGLSKAGITSSYRLKLEATEDMPLDSDVFKAPAGYNAPQQVHITQGDLDGKAVIISWVTPSNQDPRWSSTALKKGFIRTVLKGKFQNTHFTTIHVVSFITVRLIGFSIIQSTTINLERMGHRLVSFGFGLLPVLVLMYRTNLESLDIPALPEGKWSSGSICRGSYADNHPFYDNRRWDTWGRFVERSTAYQPWIWTAGNHELEFLPEVGETKPFKSFEKWYHVPYKASNNTSPLWYSVKRASAHIIVLSSYSAYGTYTPQYMWFQEELARVDRSKTPWLIVLMHSPWYNSNSYHYMEGETMRVQFESWFINAKVDIVFVGHVHAYERYYRVSNVNYDIINGRCTPIINNTAPVYINIGDDGNVEGLASMFTEPQPAYSAFREASFGRAMLEIKNWTHAFYYWHRNQDGNEVIGVSYWLHNVFLGWSSWIW